MHGLGEETWSQAFQNFLINPVVGREAVNYSTLIFPTETHLLTYPYNPEWSGI